MAEAKKHGDDGKSRRLERAVVARGRTVSVPSAERRVAGYMQDGKPIEAPVLDHYGPGREIELPPDEVKRLRALGYLVDPGAIAPAVEGPQVAEGAAA